MLIHRITCPCIFRNARLLSLALLVSLLFTLLRSCKRFLFVNNCFLVIGSGRYVFIFPVTHEGPNLLTLRTSYINSKCSFASPCIITTDSRFSLATIVRVFANSWSRSNSLKCWPGQSRFRTSFKTFNRLQVKLVRYRRSCIGLFKALMMFFSIPPKLLKTDYYIKSELHSRRLKTNNCLALFIWAGKSTNLKGKFIFWTGLPFF